MFTPTRIQLKHMFYPTGNTPAVNLLRDLPHPSENEGTINLLLLGCGDPRSILFTLWNEQGQDSKRHLTFTCCDIAPAVLARNVVLLTLISDRFTMDKGYANNVVDMWNLFYHLLIPRSSLEVLRTHALKLYKAAKSLETWAASSYGVFIGYLNKAILEELRIYWSLYSNGIGEAQSSSRDAMARKAMGKRAQENHILVNTTGLRTAGPFWFSAGDIMAEAYRKYWETGVVGGNPQDVSFLGGSHAKKGEVNPMFAISADPEPLLGFHLAEAFQETAKPLASMAGHSKRVVELAKAQFKDWCCAFKKYANMGRVRIYLFYGDALTLGHELQMELRVQRKFPLAASTYTMSWSACPLELDGLETPVTEAFDVIDTSNLGDHLGLINILSAAIPLLWCRASSILYTESFLLASEDVSASLSSVLGSDIATFLLMTGLAPVGLLTGVTMEAVTNEAAMFAWIDPGKGNMRQFRMRVSWRLPEFADQNAVRMLEGQRSQVYFEPKELAAYLFEMYKTMFGHEDMSKVMSRVMRMHTGQLSMDERRYTRAGMAGLLRLAKVRAPEGWEETITSFLDLIDMDSSLLVGRNSLQELYMYLHLFGLWTSDPLKDSLRQVQSLRNLGLRSVSTETGLLAKADLPPVIYLVLAVPKEKLKIFSDKKADEIGTPALHVTVTQTFGKSQYENCFFSFHCFFGKIQDHNRDLGTAAIEQDKQGWSGEGDLIVVCLVPAFTLLLGPRNGIRAGLVVTTTPETAAEYAISLGLHMRLFETTIDDERCLFLLRDAPKLDTMHRCSVQKELLTQSSSSHQSAPLTLVKMSRGHKATHLLNHVEFARDSPESKALSDKADMTIVQTSQSTLTIYIGETLKHTLTYPFPVRGAATKTKVARKSSWIKVEAPIFAAPEDDEYNGWTQIVLEPGFPPLCWSIPRVNLAIQPSLRFTKSEDIIWVRTFMGTTLSDSEKEYHQKGQELSNIAKLDLKRSLNVLFQTFLGLTTQTNNKPVKTFQLAVARNENCDTLLMATDLRHDLDLGSLVLEAYVLPLTNPRVIELRPALRRIAATEIFTVRISDAESILWKRLLPSLVERCRTWFHTSTCAYTENGGAPLSTRDNQNPLCSCGEGRSMSAKELGKYVREWAPFAKYATRIAIAPIFPIPYVESSMSDFKRLGKELVTASHTETKLECSNCKASNVHLQVCAGCNKARYCGKECQKAAWNKHKDQCNESLRL